MNISKKRLMEIIEEEFEKTTAGDIRKGAMTAARATGEGGINDKERGVIQKLQAQLTKAAKDDDILRGNVIKYAKLLSQELQKLIGDEEQQERQ